MNRAQALEEWLRSSTGGFVHPHLHIAEDNEHGVHWRTEHELNANTKLLTVPHSYALSYLNALVDGAYPVFKTRRKDFTVEALGFFYLILQHIHRKTSFWKPYLDTLPSPTSQLTTPLWFDAEDEQWLADTDVAHTMSQRKAIYEGHYTSGLAILKESGVDVSQISWDYFKWAITMFTSRSFPSRSIAPHDSKYWTTYKTGQNGQRQTVLLDMSHTPAEDLDFSVLFPVIDAGNHDYHTRVHWDFDPGRFSITALDTCSGGAQVCNNYGPKANDELLQGYGFCVEDNPFDVVLLTLRPPPERLQERLKTSHTGYFNTRGDWLADKATFRLPRLSTTDTTQLFEALPKALLELLALTISYESGFEVDPSDSGLLEQRYRPHIARVIIASLAQKRHRLNSTQPHFDSSSVRQRYAKIYRGSQIDIMTSYLQMMQSYLQGLASKSEVQSASARLVSLEDVAADTDLLAAPVLRDFLAGIEVSANTADVAQLRAAGWEDDLWVLLSCYAWLSGRAYIDSSASPLVSLAHIYAEVQPETNAEPDEGDNDLLSLVSNAAAHLPSSVWADPAWSNELINRIGGRVLKNESFLLPVLQDNGQQEMAVFLCLPAAS